jgi:hypothetical protein
MWRFHHRLVRARHAYQPDLVHWQDRLPVSECLGSIRIIGVLGGKDVKHNWNRMGDVGPRCQYIATIAIQILSQLIDR